MGIQDVLPDTSGLIVAVDLETSGLYVDDGCRASAASVAWMDEEQGHVVSVALPFDQGTIGKPEGDQGSLLEIDENLPPGEWKYLVDWLAEQWLINHHIKFDLHHLRTGTRFCQGRDLVDRVVWDTMLGQKELDPLFPLALKPTAERLGLTGGGERDREEGVKAWLKAYAKQRKMKYSSIAGRYDLVPWDVMGPYVAKDAELALLLYFHQVERLNCGEGSWQFMRKEIDKLKTFYRMERRGVRYDAQQSMEIAGVLQERIDLMAKGLPFTPDLKDAKRYFFTERGIPPYKTTEKTQQPQLDDEVLTKMVKDGVEWSAEFHEIRKLQTARSMWYEGYASAIGGDGRLRTSFRQEKVVSGRASSERINLQAIPHDYRLEQLPEGTVSVRKLITPAEGKELWEFDLAQAELRVAAKMANAKTMLRFIEEGQDAHGETAKDLFHVQPGEPRWFPMRQVSKRGNFSLIFGVGGPKLNDDVRKQTGIELGRLEADRIVGAWRKIHPEFQRKIYRDSEIAKSRRFILLANGRPRWFAPHEDTHKAFNQRVQGSIAEMVADWMVAVDNRWPDTLVLQIHDSLVLETDRGEEIAEEVAELGKQIAEAMFDVPMGVEFKKWGEN